MWNRAVVLCCFLAVSLAAVAIGPLPPKPEKFKDVEGCYFEDLDAVIPFGSSAPAKSSCSEFICGTTLVTYVTCSSVGAGPGAKLVSDPTKPYPDCCPRPEPEP